jgi:hypothetical protein
VWGGHPQGGDDAAMALTDGASVAEIVLDVRANSSERGRQRQR